MASSSENRLTTVVPRSPSAASKKLVFTYDYMGRRVRKRVYSYSAGAWNSTPTTDRKFVYDGWNLLLELNGLSSDAVLRKYTWGLDLSGQGGMGVPPVGASSIPGIHGAGGIGGLLAMNDAGTSTSHWYFYNANGDIGQLVDSSSGNFSAKYQYYPYGGEIQSVGAYATTNPFRFSTKYWDGEQQAYYYGYRYHKPKLGRWLSRDPIQELADDNLFRFVRNLPISSIDALGLQPYTYPVFASPAIVNITFCTSLLETVANGGTLKYPCASALLRRFLRGNGSKTSCPSACKKPLTEYVKGLLANIGYSKDCPATFTINENNVPVAFDDSDLFYAFHGAGMRIRAQCSTVCCCKRIQPVWGVGQRVDGVKTRCGFTAQISDTYDFTLGGAGGGFGGQLNDCAATLQNAGLGRPFKITCSIGDTLQSDCQVGPEPDYPIPPKLK